MSEYYIRTAREGDVHPVYNMLPELKPLERHRPYAYWNLFRNFGNSCFVAFDRRNPNRQEPVGFITSHPTATPQPEWFIWQIGVLPEHRKTGLAEDLQDRVVAAAIESGAAALSLTIEADNPRCYRSFQNLATRIGSSMTELDRFNLAPNASRSAPEVLYRIPLLTTVHTPTPA